jgi:hypothetical protein
MQAIDTTAPMSHYPKPTIDEVIRRVAGGEALSHVLASNAGFPSKQTWYRWLAESPELSSAYVAAVQQQVARRVYATK